MNVLGAQILATAAVVAIVATTRLPSADASVDPALNGTFTAKSDGQWAKTNESYHDEATVVSTWTIASTCTGAYDCTGSVTSDLGWTADAKYVSGMWFVTRTLDNWERCADGSTAPGRQIYKFYKDPSDNAKFIGWDTTTGPSGACGVNRPLFIEIVFTLVPR